MSVPIMLTIDPQEVKAICKEWEFDEENKEFYDPKEYKMRKALSLLEKSDYIIFCLYLEFASERKLAAILGCSRTPINRAIKRIRNEIITYYDGIDD